MPHQLRRIIAINIRNPKDGLPSGRIAELDPRAVDPASPAWSS